MYSHVLAYGSGFSFESIIRWITSSIVWHAAADAFRANPALTIGAVVALIIIAALIRKSRKGRRRPARKANSSVYTKKYNNAPKERTMTAAQWEKEQQLKDKNRN